MWKLLTSRAAGPVGAVLSLLLVIALGVTWGVGRAEEKRLSTQIDDLTSVNTVLRKDNITLTSNALAFEQSLKQCNDGLNALKTTTDAITTAGVNALKEVQKAGSAVDRKVREVDAMPRETCEDAYKILKQ